MNNTTTPLETDDLKADVVYSPFFSLKKDKVQEKPEEPLRRTEQVN